METARREQLEMAGYNSGSRGDFVCYQGADWTEDERNAYRRGYEDGKAVFQKALN